MLTLSRSLYGVILNHAFTGLPNEACGLLGGTGDGENAVVTSVYTLCNVDNSPEHFSMDPAEQFGAVKEMRGQGMRLIGNFHSHPSSPSRMSDEDKRLAYDKSLRYLIVSLESRDEPVLKCFHIDDSTCVREEPIEIKEE